MILIRDALQRVDKGSSPPPDPQAAAARERNGMDPGGGGRARGGVRWGRLFLSEGFIFLIIVILFYIIFFTSPSHIAFFY